MSIYERLAISDIIVYSSEQSHVEKIMENYVRGLTGRPHIV